MFGHSIHQWGGCRVWGADDPAGWKLLQVGRAFVRCVRPLGSSTWPSWYQEALRRSGLGLASNLERWACVRTMPTSARLLKELWAWPVGRRSFMAGSVLRWRARVVASSGAYRGKRTRCRSLLTGAGCGSRMTVRRIGNCGFRRGRP